MRMRPVDASGDWLPVLSSSEMVSGVPAVARLAECRLRLLVGDWWENPAWGCPALELLREGRPTEADGQRISRELESYVRDTPGVLDVRDVGWTYAEGQLSWSCTVMTVYGEETHVVV